MSHSFPDAAESGVLEPRADARPWGPCSASPHLELPPGCRQEEGGGAGAAEDGGRPSSPPHSARAPAPAPARAPSALFPRRPSAHLPGKWHSNPPPPRPPSATPATAPSLQALSASSRLRLRRRRRLAGSGLGLRGLPGATREAAHQGLGRLRTKGSGRTGPARSVPGMKLRPSLGSGENLLKPGGAGAGRGEDAGRNRFRVLQGRRGFLPDPGWDGAPARGFGKGTGEGSGH